MKTVVLPIENKVREFDGKLWWGLTFVNRGCEVVLGPSWDIKSAIDVIEPDVYISKDPGDGNIDFFKKLRDSGVIVCGLATESTVNSDPDQFAENKSEVLNVLDAYFAWGEVAANGIKRLYDNDKSNTNKIKITGNPRFDLLTDGLRSIYAETEDELESKYGDFILFNTNFTVGNSMHRDKMHASLQKNRPQWDIKQVEMDYSRIRYSFMELILYLVSNDLDHNIVVRPHPGEDDSFYEREFKYYDDIHVRLEGDVRSWIYAADGVIHFDCTTGSESAIMKKPVLSYQPLPDVANENSLSQIVSETSTTREGVKQWIKEYVEPKKKHNLSEEQREELRKYFPNIDQIAAPKICDEVDKLLDAQAKFTKYQMSSREKLEREIKTLPFDTEIIDLYDWFKDITTDGNHRQARRKLRQKFPGMNKDEIIDRHRVYANNIDLCDISVEKVPKSQYTYRIRPKE